MPSRTRIEGRSRLTSGSESRSIPIEVSVLDLTVPNEDVVTLDSNSYGTSWMFDQYPKTLSRKDDDKSLSFDSFVSPNFL